MTIDERRLISLVLSAFVLLALVLAGSSGRQREVEAHSGGRTKKSSSSTTTNNTTSRPYWQRPGCHLVGHTRTISIPGCVKFNLSTNACRGYCMSFSIPAPDDIGPAPVQSQEEAASGAGLDSRLLALLATSGENYASDLQQQEQEQQVVGARMASKRKKSSLVADLSLLPQFNQQQQQQQQQQQPGAGLTNKESDTFWHLSGQTRSPLAGAIGNINDKRDLISVGQCCNMMETEDVTVNLRCGHNETRRLVFKTAKTCECFFCKHV